MEQKQSYKTWAQTDIEAYRPVKDQILVGIYAAAGLLTPQTNPAARFDYLFKYLDVETKYIKLIEDIIEKDGAPAALNKLEKMAIDNSEERATKTRFMWLE